MCDLIPELRPALKRALVPPSPELDGLVDRSPAVEGVIVAAHTGRATVRIRECSDQHGFCSQPSRRAC